MDAIFDDWGYGTPNYVKHYFKLPLKHVINHILQLKIIQSLNGDSFVISCITKALTNQTVN